MKQHEFVTGADWAVTNNWSFTFRYSRKRLDNTIEDMSITDNLGFYIGNPGTPFAGHHTAHLLGHTDSFDDNVMLNVAGTASSRCCGSTPGPHEAEPMPCWS